MKRLDKAVKRYNETVRVRRDYYEASGYEKKGKITSFEAGFNWQSSFRVLYNASAKLWRGAFRSGTAYKPRIPKSKKAREDYNLGKFYANYLEDDYQKDRRR